MRFILFFMIVVFLTSCSEKQNSSFFEPTKYQQQALIYTKRDEFSIDKTRYLAMTTYASSINDTLLRKDKEEFIVAVYSSKENQKEIILDNVILNNSTQGIEVEKLSHEDKRLKFTLMQNSWTNYFLITTPLIDKPNLNLSYEIDHLHTVSSAFLKEL